MIEFEVNSVQYRADKLDAFKQLHVSRKIAPTVPKLIPVFVALQKAGKDDMGVLAEAAAPFAEALASMPDADVEYVVKACLGVVKRGQGNTFSPMVSPDGTLMFSDMGLGDMLPIVARVLRESLGNFIQGLLGNVPAVLQASPPQAG